jgi:hypothetical protein
MRIMVNVQTKLAIAATAISIGFSGCKTMSPPDWTQGWMESKPEVQESAYARPARLA